MQEEKTQKIANLKEKLAASVEGSEEYSYYSELLAELEGPRANIAEATQVIVHRTPEPEICESCQ